MRFADTVHPPMTPAGGFAFRGGPDGPDVLKYAGGEASRGRKDQAMPRVMIECPDTGKQVYTGINLNWETFESYKFGSQTRRVRNAARITSGRGPTRFSTKPAAAVRPGAERAQASERMPAGQTPNG